MTVNTPGESLFFLPFGNQVLAFTCEEFLAALERGRVLTGSTATAPPSGANGGEPERLLTASEISAATGIPSGWYLECARRREIPFVKLGRYPRFQLSKVVEHGLVTPPTEAGGNWARKKPAAGGAS